MKDPLRQAMLDVRESLYQIQVLIAPLDPTLLDQVSNHLVRPAIPRACRAAALETVSDYQTPPL